MILNSISSYGISFFILYYKPYNSKLDNIMNLYIERNTFLILSVIVALIDEDLPTSLYDTRMDLSSSIYTSIMVPDLVNLYLLIYTNK